MYLYYIISIFFCVFLVFKVNGMDDCIIIGFCFKYEMVWEFFMDVVKCKCGGYCIYILMNCNIGNVFVGIWICENF